MTGTVPTLTDTATFNQTSQNGATTVQLDAANGAALGITFVNTGTTLLQSDSATARTLTIGTSGITINSGAGAVTLGNATNIMNVSLDTSATFTNNSSALFTIVNGISSATTGAQVLTIAGSGDITISGAISNGTATSLGITKNGAGTLTLSSTNTFTGPFTINAGVVSVGANAQLGDAASALTLNGGTLRFTASGTYRAMTLGANGGTFNTTAGSGNTSTGIISGAGSGVLIVNNTAGGLYVPNQQSTYTGGTRLIAGLVVPTVSTTLSGLTVVSGPFGTGTLEFAGSSSRATTATGGATIANAVLFSANTTFVTATNEKTYTFSGPQTIGLNNVIITNNIGATVAGISLTISGAIGDGGNGYGIIFGGAAGLTRLQGANTYTGTTGIAGTGTTRLDFSPTGGPTTNILSSSSNLMLMGTATLNLTGETSQANSQTVAQTFLSGHNNITFTPGGSGGSVSLDFGSINRSFGGGLNFTTSTATSLMTPTFANNPSTGIIAPWFTFGGTDYAIVSAGNIVALNNSTNTSEAGWTDANANYTLTGVATETLGGNRTANTLRIINPAATTIALGTNTLTTNGILFAGTGPHGVSGTAGSGFLTIGSTNEIVLAGTQAATISAPITGLNGRIVKVGTNTVTITSTDPTYNGGIFVNSGRIAGNNTGGNFWGNNPVYVSLGAEFQGINTTGATIYLREISGGGNIFQGTGTAQSIWSVSVIEDATFSGGVVSNRFPTMNVTGPGTWTLTGPAIQSLGGSGSTFVVNGGNLVIATGAAPGATGAIVTAPVITAGGTLTFDNTAGNSNKFADTVGITLSSGTLKLIGNGSANTSETIGAISLSGISSSTVSVDRAGAQTATLTSASLTRATFSALNVVVNSTSTNSRLIFTTAPTLVNGVVPGVFANGADLATHGGNGTPIVALGAGMYANPADINSVVATDNLRVDGNTTTTTLAGSLTANSLKIDGAQTISLGANQFNLGTSSAGTSVMPATILKTGGGSATISGTTGQLVNTGATTLADFIIRVDTGDLTITAPVNIGSSTSGGFNKTGPGLLILDPASAWTTTGTGRIRALEGTMRWNPGATAYTGSLRTISGGTYELTADYSPTLGGVAGNLALTGDTGFAAYDLTLTNTPKTFGTNLAWGPTSNTQIPNGRELMLNSPTANTRIIISGTVALGSTPNEMWFREITVAGNADPNAYAEISGQVTGGNQYHLLKNGPGRLDLTNANNTYAGETIVKAGRLNVNGSLSSLTAPSHGEVTVMTGGSLGGTGTINRPVTVESGGTLTPGLSPGTLTVNGAVALEAGSQFFVELNGITVNTQYDQLVIGTGGSINVTGATLTGSVGFAPSASDLFFIVDNQSANPVVGTFASGSTVTFGGYSFAVSYVGDVAGMAISGGNDIVLYNAALVPEPQHVFLICVVALAIGWSLRRRYRLAV